MAETNGNGSATRAVWRIFGIVLGTLGGGASILGAVWFYGALCNRVDTVEGQVVQHELKIAVIDKTYVEVQGDLREIKTDLKWIRQRLRTPE